MSLEYPDRRPERFSAALPDEHKQDPESPLNIPGMNRREFVVGVSALTGGAALHVPALHAQATIVSATPATSTKTVSIRLKINGEEHSASLDPRVTLLDFLRERLDKTGTKKGCDHGQCGACTVLANGRRINSCLSLAVTHDGDEVTTIEGLANGEALHPMQAAFVQHDGFQCGYCTPGQICSAVALLEEYGRGDASFVTEDLAATPELTIEEIRERMSGNICRCGAYPGIVSAVESVHADPAGRNRQGRGQRQR